MKLSDLGSTPIDINYLEDQRMKFGWEGLMPVNLSDDALLSLVKDKNKVLMRKGLRVHLASAAVSFIVKTIIFGIDKNGVGSKLRVTSTGMHFAIENFYSRIEHEIICRLTDGYRLSSPEGDAGCIRKFALGKGNLRF